MTMNRMIRLAVFSTYLCAVSSAQTLGLKQATVERGASTWDMRLHELISSGYPEIWSATPPVDLFVGVLPPWQR